MPNKSTGTGKPTKEKPADSKVRAALQCLAEAKGQADESWRVLGFPPPQTIEDLEHIARFVEKEPGPLTAAEIWDWARAWLDREKFRAALSRSANRTPATEAGEEANPKRRRGRPLNTKGEALKLYRDWKAAHQKTGISKPEFLRGRGLPETDLLTLERGRTADYRRRKLKSE
jgi:hypothetical protein